MVVLKDALMALLKDMKRVENLAHAKVSLRVVMRVVMRAATMVCLMDPPKGRLMAVRWVHYLVDLKAELMVE